MSAIEQQVHSAPPVAAEQSAAHAGERTGDDLCQFVICRIGNEEFAVDVLSVQEINRIAEVTRVPKTPPYVEGVINLRGRIIPVLDLRKLFGLTGAKQTTQTRIVVVSVQSRLVGLVVDSVEEVLRVPKSAIEPPPSVGTMVGSEFTQGVGRIEDRLLILVDLNRLLLSREAA
ncbi:MAG: chemotaxis protein CheW [Nitrospira sp.]|nr:chemotaxis protein CheW [Nitrospira sp.]RIK56481.1 MAG: chemotaxis protein CheW [Nitrospira sp.]